MEREIRVYPPVPAKNLMIFLAAFEERTNRSSRFNFIWPLEKKTTKGRKRKK